MPQTGLIVVDIVCHTDERRPVRGGMCTCIREIFRKTGNHHVSGPEYFFKKKLKNKKQKNVIMPYMYTCTSRSIGY